ncbi:hypothetical protein IWQ60_004539 [Tieghemiomyces parasiticus]|uniref:NADP-dependent oxidoreductase domain-containing protein n=1 Tax=Tieghemiomyces parasiticus TaxID=78921 RepID=A0A9W8AB66_9FUNG|nr:hypothetical protein IWQ60_004539 [Tieghemiomyces parasiticus]
MSDGTLPPVVDNHEAAMHWAGQMGSVLGTLQALPPSPAKLPFPIVGYSLYQVPADQRATSLVKKALQLGYRHLDTAAEYYNETETGQGIRESGLPRSELYVTTKLRDNDYGFDPTTVAFNDSLKKLGLDYVDLCLIHSLHGGPRSRLESWRAMEQLHREGRVKSIDVSNYGLNQHDIAVAAYSPLSRGKKSDDPTLTKLATKYNRTWVQILVRWLIQRGYVALVKTVNEARLATSIDVLDFELSDVDMKALDALHEDLHVEPVEVTQFDLTLLHL